MRVTLSLFTTVFLLIGGLAPAMAAGAALVLEGATVIDGTGARAREEATVVVRNGRIACIGAKAACARPDGATVIDVRGKWITPGVVDAHVHYGQTGWADGRPDAFDVRAQYPFDEVQADLRDHPERFHRALLCSGVTAVFDVGSMPYTFAFRRPAENNPDAPHYAAAGPLITQAFRDILELPAEKLFLRLTSEDAGRAAVHYLAANHADGAKVWFIPPTPDDRAAIDARVMAVGRAAREASIPLIVHATTLREAKVALRAGARLLVHSVGDAPVDDEFIKLARRGGAIYTPTLTVVGGYLRMYASAHSGKPPAIDDPNGCVDRGIVAKVLSTGDWRDRPAGQRRDAAAIKAFEDRRRTARAVEAANLLTVSRAGIPIAMGTDAGNPLTLHGPSVYAEMEAMQKAGMSPGAVLTAATRISARAMGREADFGTLAKGKIADLLVLGANPLADIANMRKLEMVVRAGVAHRQGDLRAPVVD